MFRLHEVQLELDEVRSALQRIQQSQPETPPQQQPPPQLRADAGGAGGEEDEAPTPRPSPPPPTGKHGDRVELQAAHQRLAAQERQLAAQVLQALLPGCLRHPAPYVTLCLVRFCKPCSYISNHII